MSNIIKQNDFWDLENNKDIVSAGHQSNDMQTPLLQKLKTKIKKTQLTVPIVIKMVILRTSTIARNVMIRGLIQLTKQLNQ